MKARSKTKICPNCNESFTVGWNKRNQKCCSISCANKYRGGWNNHKSVNWSKVNNRSYANGNNRIGGGKTKWYDYKNIRVQGTYELKTCEILDRWKKEKKIKDWEYTNDRISYIGLDNKKHTYLIDFKIFKNDNSWYYLEVKGYKHKDDQIKWDSVRNKGFHLEVWFKEDIASRCCW